MRIPIRHRGKIATHAQVDIADAWAIRYKWYLNGKGYAIRNTPRIEGRHTTESLHRLILGLKLGDLREGDHKNGDRLDCRRRNLRIVTHAQQVQNTRSRGGTSKYRGVDWYAPTGKWRAQAQVGGKKHSLGYFYSETDAAQAASEFRAKHMPFSIEGR